jgi:hypothetical protein
MFAQFSKKITKINSKATSSEIRTWKQNSNTAWCLENLDTQIQNDGISYLDQIVNAAFHTNITPSNIAFARAVCYCVLSIEHDGIKLDEHFIEDLMAQFLVIFYIILLLTLYLYLIFIKLN